MTGQIVLFRFLLLHKLVNLATYEQVRLLSVNTSLTLNDQPECKGAKLYYSSNRNLNDGNKSVLQTSLCNDESEFSSSETHIAT